MDRAHHSGIVTVKPSWLHRLLRTTPGKMPSWVLHRGACAEPDAVQFAAIVALLLPMLGIGCAFETICNELPTATQWSIGISLSIIHFGLLLVCELTWIEKARRCERVARRRVPLGPSKKQA